MRRLQAFEDAQARRLDHFQATRSLHLRFQAAQGAFEASYAGDFFFRRDHGFDWVWQDFYVGGVKWKSKKIPSVPLIQPEKVASMPAEIRLTKDYDYRLRGTATVDGRDCWVIDFRPLEASARPQSLPRHRVGRSRDPCPCPHPRDPGRSRGLGACRRRDAILRAARHATDTSQNGPRRASCCR